MKKIKVERWGLPKTFKPSKNKNGFIIRHDGEPRFYELTKHANDKSLTADSLVKCCDCGLVHHYTYNVFAVKQKGKKSRWYIGLRAYRIEDGKVKK